MGLRVMAESRDIETLVRDHGVVLAALRRAAVAARREYVLHGLSMPVWREGALVWVAPQELELGDSTEHDGAAKGSSAR
jgi:hypothetical protein